MLIDVVVEGMQDGNFEQRATLSSEQKNRTMRKRRDGKKTHSSDDEYKTHQ